MQEAGAEERKPSTQAKLAVVLKGCWKAEKYRTLQSVGSDTSWVQALGVSFLSKLGYIIQLQLPACETREGTGVMEDANALYSSTHQVLSNSVNLFNSTNPLACCQWFMGWQALMGPFQLWRETRLLYYQHPILTLTLGASNIPTERT